MIIYQCTNNGCPSKDLCKLFMIDELKGLKRYIRYKHNGDKCEFFVRFGK